MQLTKKQISQLIHIIETSQQILAEASKAAASDSPSKSGSNRPSKRRVGKELAAFKKAIVADRKRGVPVAEIAKKHGVTPSYIYQL